MRWFHGNLVALLLILACSGCGDSGKGLPDLQIDQNLRKLVEKAVTLPDIFEKSAEISLDSAYVIGETPNFFSIGHHREIVLPDPQNKRILIYDQNGSVLVALAYDDILGPGEQGFITER